MGAAPLLRSKIESGFCLDDLDFVGRTADFVRVETIEGGTDIKAAISGAIFGE
jgi:hypothetical protein